MRRCEMRTGFYGLLGTINRLWSILLLFLGDKQGCWFDPSDLSTLFQDIAGTVPVTADGDPVALVLDKSGNGNHSYQSVSGNRLVYRASGGLHWLSFNGVNQFLETEEVPLTGTFYLACASLISGGNGVYPGPWRFLVPGANPVLATSNRIEEYSQAPPLTRLALITRVPGVAAYADVNSTKRASLPNLTWLSNGPASRSYGSFPILPAAGPFATITRDHGPSLLTLGRGYVGTFMQGNIYGFVWLSDDPTPMDRDKANTYLVEKAGIEL